MKKKIIVLALIVTLLSGCGSKIPTLSNGDEAVVILKDGSMISANELYEAIKDDYALETLVNLVDKKVLEDKYKNKVEDAKKYGWKSSYCLKPFIGDVLDEIKEKYKPEKIEYSGYYVFAGRAMTDDEARKNVERIELESMK